MQSYYKQSVPSTQLRVAVQPLTVLIHCKTCCFFRQLKTEWPLSGCLQTNIWLSGWFKDIPGSFIRVRGVQAVSHKDLPNQS